MNFKYKGLDLSKNTVENIRDSGPPSLDTSVDSIFVTKIEKEKNRGCRLVTH